MHHSACKLIGGIFSLALFSDSCPAQQKEITDPSPMAHMPNLTSDVGGRAQILQKLHAIVIPEIQLSNVTLDQAVDFLRLRSAEHDLRAKHADEAGIVIVVRHEIDHDLPFSKRHIRSLSLRNATMADVLKRVCYAVGYRYVVRDVDILLEPDATIASKSNVALAPTPPEKKEEASQQVASNATKGTSELSMALSPLVRPDLASAKMVIENLKQLAESKSGAEKVAAEQLCSVVRNMFTSEFLVTTKMKALEKSEADAKQQEKLAEQWMKPNAFGTVNKDAARAARDRAREIRKNARRELAEARDTLRNHLRNADQSVMIYVKRNDANVAALLGRAIHAINDRSLTRDAYQPTLSLEEINNMNSAGR